MDRRRFLASTAAAGGFLATSSVGLAAEAPEAAIDSEVPLPQSGPVGLAFSRSTLWVSYNDWDGDNIYGVGVDGIVKYEFSLEGELDKPRLFGLAADDDRLFGVGVETKGPYEPTEYALYEFTPMGERKRRELLDDSPRGLAYDGSYFYTSLGGSVVSIDMQGDVVRGVPIDTGQAYSGFCFDGRSLWGASGEPPSLLKFSPDGSEQQAYSLPDSYRPLPSALAHDGDDLYAGTDGQIAKVIDTDIDVPKPIAKPRGPFPEVRVDEPAEYDASSSHGTVDPNNEKAEIIGYEWDFGDGTTKTGEIVTHAYESAGEYDVSLTVTNEFEKEHTATQTISAIEVAASSDGKADGTPGSGGSDEVGPGFGIASGVTAIGSMAYALRKRSRDRP